MLQIPDRRRAMIAHLCDALPEHGYRTGQMPEATAFSAGSLAEIDAFADREKLSDFAGVSGFILGESDGAQLFGNLDDDAIRLERLDALSRAGILPEIVPIKGGLLQGAGRVIGSMANTNQDIDRLFNEIIVQGVTALGEVRDRAVVPKDPFADAAPEADRPKGAEERVSTYEKSLARRAAADGLMLTEVADPGRAAAMTDPADVQALLFRTDPNVGLSPGQNIRVSSMKSGMQGLMRKACQKENRQAAYDALREAGVVPVLDHAPRERSGNGIFARVRHALSEVFPAHDPSDYHAEMISAGRALLRDRLEDLVAEPRPAADLDVTHDAPAPA